MSLCVVGKWAFFLLGQIAAQNIRYKIKENSLCSMHTVYPIGSDPRSKVFVSKGSVNWMRAAFCFNGLYKEPSWDFAPFVNIFCAQSEQWIMWYENCFVEPSDIKVCPLVHCPNIVDAPSTMCGHTFRRNSFFFQGMWRRWLQRRVPSPWRMLNGTRSTLQ